jgi:hypothetical protein
MKRTLAIVVVLIVALAVVPLALASNGKGKHGKAHHKHGKAHHKHGKAHGKNTFQLNGVVVSVVPPGDPEPGSLTVTVKSGSKTVKAWRGLDLTLIVTPNARFVDSTADDCDEATDPATPPLTVADLVPGARVHLGGTIDRTVDPWVFTATKVILQSLPEVVPPL